VQNYPAAQSRSAATAKLLGRAGSYNHQCIAKEKKAFACEVLSRTIVVCLRFTFIDKRFQHDTNRMTFITHPALTFDVPCWFRLAKLIIECIIPNFFFFFALRRLLYNIATTKCIAMLEKI